MASFISAILLNGGYSEKEIKLNSFDIEEGVPMMDESVENVFDGGENSQSSQNIEVIKKGQLEKLLLLGLIMIVQGTHGVDDNGSGVAVALENALRMIDVETQYTIKYVFLVRKRQECMVQENMLILLQRKKKTTLC